MPPDRWFRQGHPIFVHDSGLFLLGAPRSHSRIWGSHEAGVPVTPGVLSPLGEGDFTNWGDDLWLLTWTIRIGYGRQD